MTAHLLRGADVVTDAGLLPGGWVLVEGEAIADVGPASRRPPPADGVTNLTGAALLPGFVDVHVHGGGGGSFGGDAGSALTAARFHGRAGTTALLGGLVSADADALAGRLGRLAAAGERLDGGPRLLGAHLEGPFISPARRGAHDPAQLRPAAATEVQRLLAAGAGRLRLVTAAPEVDGFATLAGLARAAGAVVSAGHTDADEQQLAAGIAAGARSLTHTLNAMRPPHHRSPGPLGAVTDASVFCELVADGHHLHPATVRMLRRLAGADRVVLVTDAVPWAGLPDGEYRAGGPAVEVRDFAVRLAGTDVLAGSMLTMSEAVRRYARFTGAPLTELAAAASTNPARLLGEDGRLGRIRPGHAADLVVLDRGLECRAVMVAGAWVRPPDAEPAPGRPPADDEPPAAPCC